MCHISEDDKMRDSRIKIKKIESGEIAVTLFYNPVYVEKFKGIK